MSYHLRLELFAWIALICGLVVVLADFASEFSVRAALRFRWSLLYQAIRYIGMGCAAVVVLDAVRN
jgi:hypothetical protein